MKSYAAFGKIICFELRQLKKLLAAALDRNMSASAIDKSSALRNVIYKLCLDRRQLKNLLGAALDKNILRTA